MVHFISSKVGKAFSNTVIAVLVMASNGFIARAVHAGGGDLMQIARPSLSASPLHKHEIRDVAMVNEAVLQALQIGDTIALPLPTGRRVMAVLRHKNQPISGAPTASPAEVSNTFSLEGENGSVELILQNGKLRKYFYYDLSGDTPRVFRSAIAADSTAAANPATHPAANPAINPTAASPATASPATASSAIVTGVIIEDDAHDYFCIDMPNSSAAHAAHSPTANAKLADDNAIAHAPPPGTDLRKLQSKPGATNILLIHYWGGSVTGSQWNAQYSNGNPINFAAFNRQGSSNSFTADERGLMWLGWRETAEDYAQFAINVTTDFTLYDNAAPSKRSTIIVTPTRFGITSGGVAFVNSFGNYSNIGWVWNTTASSLGQSIAHEAGHQMGLHHDGHTNSQGRTIEYYSGHGDWGPIMGTPFGRSYVQWSKGEYNGATQFEDDIDIIKRRLGSASNPKFNANNPAPLTIPTHERVSFIAALGSSRSSAADVDAYSFTLDSPSTVHLELNPLLHAHGEQFGTNLAFSAVLNGPNGARYGGHLAPLPYLPATNVFSYTGILPIGEYVLTIQAQSPDTNWASGFDDYGNGGYYSLNLDATPSTLTLAKALDTATVLPQLAYQSLGDAPFYGQTATTFDDIDAMRSGAIGDGESSSISLEVTGMAQIAFRWKTSSEAERDYLRFYVDDNEISAISGDTDWRLVEQALSRGAHTLKWAYSKNFAAAEGDDAGFIDKVELTAFVAAPLFSVAAVDASKAEGDSDSTAFSFAVINNGDLAAATLNYTITGDSDSTDAADSADADDFTAESWAGGVITFTAEQAEAAINIEVLGDREIEKTEGFRLAIDTPSVGNIAINTAVGLIYNDDINDGDSDKVADKTDNCPGVANPKQTDTDKDGQGNVCDPDDDGDGKLDGEDNCPLIANKAQTDTDDDGIGNACEAADFCFPVISDKGTAVICL